MFRVLCLFFVTPPTTGSVRVRTEKQHVVIYSERVQWVWCVDLQQRGRFVISHWSLLQMK